MDCGDGGGEKNLDQTRQKEMKIECEWESDSTGEGKSIFPITLSFVL